MTDEELEDYATELLLEHAQDIELLTIHECYESWFENAISIADAQKVQKLIGNAQIAITFPTAWQELEHD